ncbi:universal stress protein [Changchengzhania lutea]|uniref:universal stress protein n=1 Tax=Changchengzhania lutea TaxID=2049305 RepID=UPI00115E5CF1|nr:universal stress protein [Changchengzhania lutea]
MKTILYGTDCTDNDANALRYAYRFSSIMKADLHVLHVYDFPPINFLTIQPKELLKKRMQQEQKDILTNYCTKHLKNEFRQKPITIHAVENVSIINGILDKSKMLLPNLVILGMKDSRSKRRYFSSNIAEALLDKIELPILIVPNGLRHEGLSTIVYATDFEKEDIMSIKKLIEIAIPFGALIEIIHVFETEHYHAKENMERFKNILLKEVSYSEITFRTITSVKVKSGLLSVLKKEHATMLAMLAMLERKHNSGFNLFSRKDLVKDIGATVSIPLLAFSKHSTKSKKANIPGNKKIMEY